MVSSVTASKVEPEPLIQMVLAPAVKAGVAHGVVVGNQTATIGFLDAVVIGGGNQVQVTSLQAARHTGDAAHLPHGGGERNLLRHDLARLARVHLVGGITV